MKCIEIVKPLADRRLEVGKIVRVSDFHAAQYVNMGRAKYVSKGEWKVSGRERG